jgi:hypothetical protein
LWSGEGRCYRDIGAEDIVLLDCLAIECTIFWLGESVWAQTATLSATLSCQAWMGR